MTSFSPLDIIGSQRWQRALFTTYSLSLTFFESVVLRELRRQGCEEVWVLVDADGYRASLMERRSARVGHEYRLIPVALRNGVFHPKLCYLQGQDGDRLLVGSGNLTFGGFGRNLEILETLSSEDEPNALADLASFLELLGANEDIQIADRSPLTEFSARARSWQAAAEGVVESASARLLHGLEQDVIAQLAGAAGALGTCETLTVLSPFHDSAGHPVRRLAELTGCQTVRIGTSLGDRPTTTFPLDEAASWSQAIETVQPVATKSARRLHAKYWQLDGDAGRWVFSGSVNATEPAVRARQNVELGVLRINGTPPCEWQPVKAEHEPLEQDDAPCDGTQACVVHATLHGEMRLQGAVLAPDPFGEWEGSLSRPSGMQASFRLSVDEDGRFDARVPEASAFAQRPSVQLTLQREGVTASGWLHHAELLSFRARGGLTTASLVRLLAREEVNDDLAALLDYLAVASARQLASFAQNPRSGPGSGDGEERETTRETLRLSAAELAPSSDVEPSDAGLPWQALGVDPLSTILSRLRHAFLGEVSGSGERDRPPANPISPELEADEEDEEQAEAGDPEREWLTNVLTEFEDALRARLDGADDRHERALFLVIALEVGLHFRVHRLGDVDEARAFARSWLGGVARRGPLQAHLPSLDEHVHQLVAVLTRASGEDAPLLELHEVLEAHHGGVVSAADAVAALPSAAPGVLRSTFGEQEEGLADAVQRVLATKTRRATLEQCLQAAERGEALPEGLEELDCPAGRRWRKLVQRGIGPRSVVRSQREDVCSACFESLPPGEQIELRLYRLTSCSSPLCSKINVRVAP